MRWLAVWLLLGAVHLGGLLLCRSLTGGLHLTRADGAGLLLIPLTQLAALAILAAGSRPRREAVPAGELGGVRRRSPAAGQADGRAREPRDPAPGPETNREPDSPDRGPMHERRRRRLVAAIVVAVVLPLALAARWRWAAVPDGPQLRPRPDALEYAAAAQAIAQEGRYYLQIGPHQVRPRYPPGWPLVLAAAVRLGVAGDDLWRVPGIFGAALASLLGLLAASAVFRLRPDGSWATAGGALAAGLVTGAGWALAPVAVAVGRVALGDEPAAFVACLALAATASGMLSGGARVAVRPLATIAASGAEGQEAGAPGPPGVPARGNLTAAASPDAASPEATAPRRASAARPFAGIALGGVCFGLLAAMRPANAALLAPAAVVLAAAGWRSLGRRAAAWRVAAWAAGAALVPLLVAGLLWRSHLSPWRWSAYDLWAPRWYADLRSTFSLRYALRGNDDFTRGAGDRPIPNAVFIGDVLLGRPGLDRSSYLGSYWPALGWLAGALLAWRWRRRRFVAAAALASLAVTATFAAFHALYFFPAARFLLVPLTLPLLALGIACGAGLASASPSLRLGAGLAAAALAASMTVTFATYRAERPPSLPDRDPRTAVAAWLRLPDAARAAVTMPFDPLEAQALGLLPPATTARLRVWGALPPTVQVRRLRALGLLPAPGSP